MMNIGTIMGMTVDLSIAHRNGMNRLGMCGYGHHPGVIAGHGAPDDAHERAVDPAIHPRRWSRRSNLRMTSRDWVIVVSVAAGLVAAVAPAYSANAQPSNETLRAENEYRECLYSKTRSGRYAHGERESDFGLIGECRNQWVAYMDACNKEGFDNPACVMKSRLVIHAILNLTGK
jgi:hypothetical protein